MTFHFMPGLWLDDWGLEITESILITDTGVETFCNTPRKPFVKEIKRYARVTDPADGGSFNADGEQHGFLNCRIRRDDSAWGAVMIPVTVIRRGEGPTVLLTGGNHGDEYEGPIALSKLAARRLKPSDHAVAA